MHKDRKMIIGLIVFILIVIFGTIIVFGELTGNMIFPGTVKDLIDFAQSDAFFDEDVQKSWFTTNIVAYPAPIDRIGAYCIDPHTPNATNIGYSGQDKMKVSAVVDILPPSEIDSDEEAFEDSPAGGVKVYTYSNGKVKENDMAINEASSKILLKLGYLATRSTVEGEGKTSLANKQGFYKIAMSELFGSSKKILKDAGIPAILMNQYKSNVNVNSAVRSQLNEANKAVSKLYNISLANKTNADKVTAENIDGKTYIGPYKVKFNNCNIAYVKYDGNKLTKYATEVGDDDLVSFSELESGESFYIVVNGSITDLEKQPKIYTTKVEVYRVRMIFGDGGADTQNFIFYKGYSKSKSLSKTLPSPSYISGTRLNIIKLENNEIKGEKIENLLDMVPNQDFVSYNLKAGFATDSDGGYVDDIETAVAEKYGKSYVNNINALDNVAFIIAHRVETQPGVWSTEYITGVDKNNEVTDTINDAYITAKRRRILKLEWVY